MSLMMSKRWVWRSMMRGRWGQLFSWGNLAPQSAHWDYRPISGFYCSWPFIPRTQSIALVTSLHPWLALASPLVFLPHPLQTGTGRLPSPLQLPLRELELKMEPRLSLTLPLPSSPITAASSSCSSHLLDLH